VKHLKGKFPYLDIKNIISSHMKTVLITWVGRTDLQAADGKQEAGEGPVGQAVGKIDFDEVNLLCNYPRSDSNKYVKWVKKKTRARIVPHQIKLTGPTDFGEIYEAAVTVIAGVLTRIGPDRTTLIFHLSPGTPAMAAVFVLLAKTRFPAEIIQTSREKGLQRDALPFDITADYIPDLLRRPDEEMERLSAGLPPETPEFDEIIRSSGSVMNKVIALARRVAPHRVSVLIEGESGTGKELIARAIHKASPFRDKAFVAVNCGAIPENLVESELFGHVKGAFTGATETRKGHFVAANGGTLFLDEVGELPLGAQVKLLRTLQEGEVSAVGGSNSVKVNVRVLAATNRNIATEVAAGRFREDLYYRLAVMVLRVPPLRERQGDVGPLVDGLIEQLYNDSSIELGPERKKLLAEGKALLLQQTWPGNVRELRNTLLRAIIWSSSKSITVDDVRSAITPTAVQKDSELLNRSLGDGFSLQETISFVASHYLQRALDQANGNKTKAANLVGLPSYQTLINWLKRYGLES
jgi:DNA-binding NtrC family response regulator